MDIIFQSTHPSWGATHAECRKKRIIPDISIHAPIVGCDCITLFVLLQRTHFNPRTHRGVRPLNIVNDSFTDTFQSTHPSWGATLAGSTYLILNGISIHAPIVGCDRQVSDVSENNFEFQSTHPSWGATIGATFRGLLEKISIHAPIVGCDHIEKIQKNVFQISIHAPIVGCDQIIYLFKPCFWYFNPRTHRGVRPMSKSMLVIDIVNFNPRTHRGVRRIIKIELCQVLHGISIHAPIVGCD